MMSTFGHDPRKQVKNCCQNHSEKCGGTPTEQHGKWHEKTGSNSCRENVSLLFRSTMLHSAGEKLNSFISCEDLWPPLHNRFSTEYFLL